MSPAPEIAPPVLNPAPNPERTLRKLFLTLFLRGRSSRGLRVDHTPKTIGRKLSLVLVSYALFGCLALSLVGKPVFGLAVYLHSMTFVFLGLFVASSAGEILFNKEEADILLHRPVSSRDLLWSKVRVLVQVSIWLAGAFNLAGLFAGIGAKDGSLLFPPVHAVSTALEAVFCTSCVILVYQLCLRWFGRERLDGLMTTAQVIVAVAAVFAGQILPRLVFQMNGTFQLGAGTWWIGFLPPAWFAGIDDALAGSHTAGSFLLAGIGLAIMVCVVWLAFVKLASDYEAGLQSLGETVSRPSSRGRRRLDALIKAPPLRWFLRNSVSRASFLLTAAYLIRDRDVKLRVYPGLAPMLVMPVVFLSQGSQTHGAFPFGFALAYSGGFLASMPLLAIDFLQYSQQWQAADIFRVAPISGPSELCHGARKAVLALLVIPFLLVVAVVMFAALKNISELELLLPGLILAPVLSLVPAALDRGTPLSQPAEAAKSASRTLIMLGVMLVTLAVSGIAYWSWTAGWFKWVIISELFVCIPVFIGLRLAVARLRWQPID